MEDWEKRLRAKAHDPTVRFDCRDAEDCYEELKRLRAKPMPPPREPPEWEQGLRVRFWGAQTHGSTTIELGHIRQALDALQELRADNACQARELELLRELTAGECELWADKGSHLEALARELRRLPWVSVAERLPPEDVAEVFAVYRGEERLTAALVGRGPGWHWMRPAMPAGPIHWMALPPLPEADQKLDRRARFGHRCSGRRRSVTASKLVLTSLWPHFTGANASLIRR